MNRVPDEMEREVPTGSLAVLQDMSRGELDQQVTTARAYPRSLKRFISECMDMATLTEAIASECIYALPRGGKTIEGPSARLAEIVQSAWGNCSIASRVVDETTEFVVAQGQFFDLERNVRITTEVRRRITGKNGKRFDSDMVGVTGNAACTIARRNAVFAGIPKAFWSAIYDAAKKAAIGDVKTIANRRADALAYLQKMGVTPGQVLRVLNVAGVEDIGTDELLVLRGLITAIKDGDASVDSVFGDPKGTGGVGKVEIPKPDGYDAWLDALRPVADEGIAKLTDIFARSDPKARAFLTGPDNAVWEALKAKAMKVAV